MSRLIKLNSHKKEIVLLISISLVVIGFVPQLTIRIIRDANNPYNVEPLALESEDGTYISSFLYTPKGEKSHGGIVVSHRYWGDKKIMEPLSIELVRRGFSVISIDFRGHGASGGQFIWSELVNDMKAAVDYFEYELPYITQIGLIGHSLGAMVAAELARVYPNKINATVAIGSLNFDPSGISNLLMMFGQIESVVAEERLLDALRIYTGEENVSIGRLYFGDFIGGNNTKAFIGDFSNHLSSITDPSIMHEIVQWFEQVFNDTPAENIVLTEWFLEIFSLFSQLGIILLYFILIIYISNIYIKKKNDPQEEETTEAPKIDVKRLISYFTLIIMGFGIIFLFFFLSIPRDIIQLTVATSTLLINVGAVIAVFVLLLFLIMNSETDFSFKSYKSKIRILFSAQFKRSLVFGISSALLLIMFLFMFWNLPYQTSLSEGRNWGIIISLIFSSFPIFFIKEFYLRILQDNLKKSKTYAEYFKMVFIGIFMENLIIVFIFSVIWLNVVYMPISILYFSAWIRFSIILNVVVPFIYIYAGRSILGSAIFSSVIYAWLTVIILPSYGFL